MQPTKGQHKRIVSASVLVVAVAVAASSAFARSGSPRAQPSASPTLKPCTAGQCALHSSTRASDISVVPTDVPAGSSPSFTAPTSNPAKGMLHGQRVTGALDCAGYKPTDTAAYQFFLGGTFRGNVVYKVTDTVNNANPAKLQFCLGATFTFQTSSRKPAKAATLPNGLSGFVGLVPSCANPVKPPCLVSKTRDPSNSSNAVLKLLVPAVAGADPWGRS